MSKTELLAIIVAVNGGLWLLLALIDWLAVRLTQYRGADNHRKSAVDDVPPAHAH